MKISILINELSAIKNEYGDIAVQLQNDPSEPAPAGEIIDYESFFVVAEEYEDAVYCNLRTWPY